MANQEHLDLLAQGVAVWNRWREEHPDVAPDLSETSLIWADLRGVDFSRTSLVNTFLTGSDLSGALLLEADLNGADLSSANLHKAIANKADLGGADLTDANLYHAMLMEAYLGGAVLVAADLRGAYLDAANLWGADLSGANLRGARLSLAELLRADLTEADLTGADLTVANLSRATLVETVLDDADLTGANIYGISVWKVSREGLIQEGLVITPPGEPAITVDDLEIAQFIYLLLNNERIRNVIDTIGKKAVLILGRFTPERKAVLDALRSEIRGYDYVPIVFDFDPARSQTTIDTISTLAHLSRFIVADVTDAKSVLGELERITLSLPSVPVQLIHHASGGIPPMGDALLIRPSVLAPYVYQTEEELLASLDASVISPADALAQAFEAKLDRIRSQYLPWQRGKQP